MRINITQRQTQRQILAPYMQQSIEVLMLPIDELTLSIDRELQENPLLEINEEKKRADQQHLDEIIQKKLQYAQDSGSLSNFDYMHDDTTEERPISRSAPLEDYLTQQLRLEFTDPMDIRIGELIIGNLNEAGFFQSGCDEIAFILSLEDVTRVESVLAQIQNFEPLGVASRDLKECLIIQAQSQFNGHSELITEIIQHHLGDIGRKKYSDIARKCKIPVEKVKIMAQMIASLEPKPARKYRPIEQNIYIKPDVYVTLDENDQLHVHINREHLPPLRINSYYKNLLNDPVRKDEEKKFIHEKIKNAILFMRSIEQRNQTIKDISRYIVHHQKNFFTQGHLALKPLTLKDVAQVVERNESTISRAINNKYFDTPQGLFPFKFFFSQGVSDDTNGQIASRSIKEEIVDLIDRENKARPLSDQEIQSYFEKRGMHVARRTVSKYRQALHILPSHLRKT